MSVGHVLRAARAILCVWYLRYQLSVKNKIIYIINNQANSTMGWASFQMCAACVTTCEAVTWHGRRENGEYLIKKKSEPAGRAFRIYAGLYPRSTANCGTRYLAPGTWENPLLHNRLLGDEPRARGARTDT